MGENALTVALTLRPESFSACAHLSCPENSARQLSFILNSDLTVHALRADVPVQWQCTDGEKPVFRSPAQRVTVTGEGPITELWVEYQGSVQFDPVQIKNWANIVTPDFVSLSYYSVWYPQELPFDIAQDRVLLADDAQDWFVVKGRWDPARSVWEYGGEGYDPFNIVAYRKERLQVVSDEVMNIYFMDPAVRPQAEAARDVYRRITEYYNGRLFPQRRLDVLDIPCAWPAIREGGGYRRRDLMWSVSPGEPGPDLTHFLAHETAHIWCTGAPAETWEDWLNETTAEWSALCFALDSGDRTLFDYTLGRHLPCAASLPPIRTRDGSRPEGVHSKGTALFYRVFEQCGAGVMEKLVRTFAALPDADKNTASYLAALRREGLTSAADLIEPGLDI